MGRGGASPTALCTLDEELTIYNRKKVKHIFKILRRRIKYNCLMNIFILLDLSVVVSTTFDSFSLFLSAESFLFIDDIIVSLHA